MLKPLSLLYEYNSGLAPHLSRGTLVGVILLIMVLTSNLFQPFLDAQSTPSCEEHYYLAGDINRDCYVNAQDVVLLAQQWQTDISEKSPVVISADSMKSGDEHPERVIDGKYDLAHRWVSQGIAGVTDGSDPHWLEMEFPRPVSFDEVRIYSGYNEEVPLFDYQLKAMTGGEWQNLAQVDDNPSIFTGHKFTLQRMEKLRLDIQQGSDKDSYARVKEVEIYKDGRRLTLTPAGQSQYFVGLNVTGQEDAFCRRAYQIMLKGAYFCKDIYIPWSEEPDSGYFGWGGVDEKAISNNAGLGCLYAMLLRFGQYDEAVTGVSREEAIRRVKGVTRYCAFLHSSNPQAQEKYGSTWGTGWHDSEWCAVYGQMVWLIWDELDDETREMAARVIIAAADRFVGGTPPSRKIDNTMAESNAWDTRMIALTTVMFPSHPRADLWRDTLNLWAMNTLTREEDKQDTTVIAGKQVKDWVVTENIHSDFTLENHGIVYPVYMWCSMYNLAEGGLYYKLAGREIPPTLHHHLADMYGVYKALQTWEGLPVYFNGTDKFLHLQVVDIFHHGYFAQVFGDAEAAYLEELELGILEQMQARYTTGRLYPEEEVGPWSRVGNLSVLLGNCYLLHYITPEPTTPTTPAAFESRIAGVTEYPDADVIVQRTPQKLVTFAWRKPYRVMGMIMGSNGGSWLVTPYERSLTGTILESGVSSEPDISVVQVTKQVQGNAMTVNIVLRRCGGKVEHAITLQSGDDDIVTVTEQLKALASVTLSKAETGHMGIGRRFNQDTVTLTSGQAPITVPGFSDDIVRTYSFSGNDVTVDGGFRYTWTGDGTVKYIKSNRYFAGSGGSSGAYGRVDDRLYVEHFNTTRHFNANDIIAQGQLVVDLDVN